MGFWYLGQTEENIDIFKEKWRKKSVHGAIMPNEPSLYLFKGIVDGIDMFRAHMVRGSRIAIHCDVDMDGVGAGKVMREYIKCAHGINVSMLINKDKVHGINERHAAFFNSRGLDLMIIVDSSTNEVEAIKKFHCDVLVLDHHEIEGVELRGETEDGHKYVIINNMADNDEWAYNVDELNSRKANGFLGTEGEKGTPDMSGAMVVYEFLRVYSRCFGEEGILINKQLYQWVGITLYTDQINTLNDRCQWYIYMTIRGTSIEPSLKTLMRVISPNKVRLDKSYINYTLAPIINKAIRAGASAEALNVIINHPELVHSLMKYKDAQQDALNRAVVPGQVFDKPYIIKDITSTGVHKNYCGVIASRLQGDNGKNCVCFIVEEGIAKGSFRGTYNNVDYKSVFASKGYYAQGHKEAFGFRCPLEVLDRLMQETREIETQKDEIFMSIGDVPIESRGRYHIVNLDEFRRSGVLWRLSIGNSGVNNVNELMIRASCRDAVLKKTVGKLYIYDVLGLECKAFSPLQGGLFDIYAEYSSDIECFVREAKGSR